MKTVKDFNVKGKRVLVRCDFNVPLSKEGEILDDFRIKKTLPTIRYLTEKGAKVVLMSHLGRPGGEVVDHLKMDPVRDRLAQLLNIPVAKAPDCIGSDIVDQTQEMSEGGVLLLENLRFHEGEKENDETFAKELSGTGDIYVNDAFGVSHRAHASVSGVTKFLPSGAGLLLEKEVEVLSELMENPGKPLVALIGGAKADTKIKVVNRISKTADFVLISGLVKNAIEEEKLQLVNPGKIVNPVDETGGGKDIGEKTVELFGEKMNGAKTIFWNGPFGKIEEEEFSRGTKEVAKAIISTGAKSIIGGGETVEFINKLGLSDKFSHVSTGGGAMLEFLAGEKLPGLESLGYYG